MPMQVQEAVSPTEQMFYILRKGVRSIDQKSLPSAKDSICSLIAMTGNDVFILACQEYTVRRFIGKTLEANNDAKSAVTGLNDFIADAVWDSIKTSA